MDCASKIKSIDLVIFPDYCGDFVEGNEYIDSRTGEKKYFSGFASEELSHKWRERAEEVIVDSTRMLIHLRDAQDSSGIPYLIDFAKFLDDKLTPTGRYITVNAHIIKDDCLKKRMQQAGLVLTSDVRVVGYGHHRRDCVPRIGIKATKSMGLDESLFEELEDLSVGDDYIATPPPSIVLDDTLERPGLG